jgi:decaprenylphospho-beta-D-erythro-pentofuranosid-2-ulose 2-reductase
LNILVYGATSAIAEAACRLWAKRGESLCLVGRDEKRLQDMAADLKLRGAPKVHVVVASDARSTGNDDGVDQGVKALGSLDAALVAHGVLPDPDRSATDATYATETLEVNLVSVVAVCTPIAKHLEEQGKGVLCVISSVAGDRGRASNYVYGAAKAGVSAYLSGLRQRLHAKGVSVVTVKPGFVDTPMTAHLPKNPLYASAQRVGKAVVHAMDRRRAVVYVPWFWRPVLRILREVPEPVFKRLKT